MGVKIENGPHFAPAEYLADLARAELAHHDDTWRPPLRSDIAARLAEQGALVHYVEVFIGESGREHRVLYRRRGAA